MTKTTKITEAFTRESNGFQPLKCDEYGEPYAAFGAKTADEIHAIPNEDQPQHRTLGAFDS